MSRRLLTALLALALAAVLGVAVAPAAQAAPSDRYERAARHATDAERAERDRVALHRDRCVQRKAERQARRMARRQRLFHQDLGPVMRDCRLSRAGENVAYGYSTGRSVVRAWMRSEGHRANILEPAYRLLGMAATRRDGIWYAVQVFGRR